MLSSPTPQLLSYTQPTSFILNPVSSFLFLVQGFRLTLLLFSHQLLTWLGQSFDIPGLYAPHLQIEKGRSGSLLRAFQLYHTVVLKTLDKRVHVLRHLMRKGQFRGRKGESSEGDPQT